MWGEKKQIFRNSGGEIAGKNETQKHNNANNKTIIGSPFTQAENKCKLTPGMIPFLLAKIKSSFTSTWAGKAPDT